MRDEYEDYICGRAFSSLDARCIVLDVLDARRSEKPRNWEIPTEPFLDYLPLFEEVLFLEADAFLFVRPESLLRRNPRKRRNLLQESDFWTSSSFPFYCVISCQEVPSIVAQQPSESAGILVHKPTLFWSLLLCIYYYLWGTTHYYRPLSYWHKALPEKAVRKPLLEREWRTIPPIQLADLCNQPAIGKIYDEYPPRCIHCFIELRVTIGKKAMAK